MSKYSVGDQIDVRDTENVWCIGEIKAIVTIKQENYVYIHYEGWNQAYNEYIPFDHERLASPGFYTNRKDIPRYILNGNGNCNVGFVLRSENDMQRINESLSQMEQEFNGFLIQANLANNEEEPENIARGNSNESQQMLANHMSELLNQLGPSMPATNEIVNNTVGLMPQSDQYIPQLIVNSSMSENANSNADVDLNSSDES